MSIKGREIKKVGITTFVTFACVTALSTMNTNNVHASEQGTANQVEINNAATAQSQDTNKISNDTQNSNNKNDIEVAEQDSVEVHKATKVILANTQDSDNSYLNERLASKNINNLEVSQKNTEEAKSAIYDDNAKIDKGSTTVGEKAKELNDKNALGIASEFGIFSKKLKQNGHINSNIATGELESGYEFGTNRSKDPSNDPNIDNTVDDISYVKHIDSLGANSFFGRGNHEINHYIVIGDENHQVAGQANDIKTNYGNVKLDHFNSNGDTIIFNSNKNKEFIDMDQEFKELENKSNNWRKQSTTDGVDVNLKDENNRCIDLTRVDLKDKEFIYVNLDANKIHDRPIKVKGLGIENTNHDLPTIIINLNNVNKDYHYSTETLVFLDNSNAPIASSENHNVKNQIVWNFGTDVTKIDVDRRIVGSVLAPNAELTGNGNIDGNIVVNYYNAAGENHRWDLASHNHTDHPHNHHWRFNWGFISKPSKKTAVGPVLDYDLPKAEVGTTPDTAPSYGLPEFHLDQPTKPTQPEEPTKPVDNVPPAPEVPDNPTKPTEPSQPTNPNTPPNIPENFIREKGKTYTYSFAHTHGQDYKEKSKKKWDKMDEEKFSYTHKTPYTRTVRDEADSLQHVVKNDAKITRMTDTKEVVSNESASELPETGANESWMASLIGFATFALGALGLKLNKKNR